MLFTVIFALHASSSGGPSLRFRYLTQNCGVAHPGRDWDCAKVTSEPVEAVPPAHALRPWSCSTGPGGVSVVKLARGLDESLVEQVACVAQALWLELRVRWPLENQARTALRFARGATASIVAMLVRPRLKPGGAGPQRILLLDEALPDRTNAGGERSLAVLRALAQTGASTSVFALSNYTDDALACCADAGANVIQQGTDLREVLRSIGAADAVIFCRPTVGARLMLMTRLRFPRTVCIYDTVDLHWLRLERSRKVDAVVPTSKVESLRRLEELLIRNACAVVFVSDEERRRCRSLIHEGRAVVIPTVHASVRKSVPASPLGRSGILFVGNYRHSPNVDAVQYLLAEILPLIKHEPRLLPIRVAGAHMDEIDIPRSLEGVEWHGWKDDLGPLHDESLAFIAPLRFGAGVKGKVTFAMSCGLPVVGTPIAAEGLALVDGIHFLVADDAGEMAEKLVQLASDDTTWTRISTMSSALASEQHSFEAIVTPISDLLELTRSRTGRLQSTVQSDRALVK
jgi:hypothetical protein